MTSPPNSSRPSPGELSRRRFLALAAVSAAMGAGCRRSPDRDQVIPYTKKSEEIVPGVATHYASAFQEGEVAYGVLVKTREGRPIHIEGNPEDPGHPGITSLRAIADLYGLYDPDRFRQPLAGGRPMAWEAAASEFISAVAGASRAGKQVLLLTRAIISPSQRKLLQQLGTRIPLMRHVASEPAMDHRALGAAKRVMGARVMPRWRLERARVVVSLGADFLGTAGDAAAQARGYSMSRCPASPADEMSRLYVLEGALSLTGSNADRRFAVRPSALGPIGFGLARALGARGRSLPAGLPASALASHDLERLSAAHGIDAGALSRMADDLHRAGERALVMAGPAAGAGAHEAAMLLNAMLGSVGTTSDWLPAPDVASPEELRTLVGELGAGAFGAVILWDVNPAYDFPDGPGFERAFRNVPARVRIGLRPDETSDLSTLVLPEHHWLESWGDLETADRDAILLAQPVVSPLFDTLQAEDILLRLLRANGGAAPPSYHDFVRERWRAEVAPQTSPVPFERFWNVCLHDGVMRWDKPSLGEHSLDANALAAAAAAAGDGDALELVLGADSRVHDGRYANNGWLQELPDPVLKTAWGNPLTLSPEDAARLGFVEGDVAEIKAGNAVVRAPVLILPEQARGVLGLALGYGQRAGSVGAGIGVNAWPLVGASGFVRRVDALGRTGQREPMTRSQDHFETGGRDIARIHARGDHSARSEHGPGAWPSLYPAPPKAATRWAMAIDLSACIGCGACVIACQSENNVPVVGPEQVRKGRAMHWIRIDRYTEPGLGAVHEPMLCQHCGHAPCENVCPVQATNHSPDGLNQMAYNRCVGTRYCANNCPYKVRRFNYLDFTSDPRHPLELAYNPEVTVRPRGVIEKCTFCVQRIRNAEQVAKNAGRPLGDGEVRPACAVACPTRAIVFGNAADPASEIARRSRSERGFRVLDELGVQPSITYLAALRNPPPRGAGR
jgi:Fe-S-cluster-containing dehydrogenase component/anaerobic selenocysteine-containing dehydrogenase